MEEGIKFCIEGVREHLTEGCSLRDKGESIRLECQEPSARDRQGENGVREGCVSDCGEMQATRK